MTRNDIKRNILQKIDEISPYQNTDEQYDLLIESMLDDMANRFLLVIPLNLIKENTKPVNTQANNYHGTGQYIDLGIFNLPADFLRLVYVWCRHWKMTVWGDELLDFQKNVGEYKRQFDRHTRAGVAKPKVFREPASLILSPFRQNWMLTDLSVAYVHKQKAEDLAEKILDGFFYFTANAVLTSMRQPDFANAMMEKFNEWLKIN